MHLSRSITNNDAINTDDMSEQQINFSSMPGVAALHQNEHSDT